MAAALQTVSLSVIVHAMLTKTCCREAGIHLARLYIWGVESYCALSKTLYTYICCSVVRVNSL
jgi:hypothetical protein